MTGRTGAPAAIVALMLLAGCGGSSERPKASATPTPTPTPTPEKVEVSDEDKISGLLRDRASALHGRRGREYASTATGAQRRRDRVHSRRAAQLRLSDVGLEPADVRVKGDRATARVDAEYGITGIDSEFESSRRVSLKRAGGRWRVTSVSGKRGLPPWEVAGFRERRSKHFVVLTPPGVPSGELVAALEDGYRTMRDLLARGRLRRRYLVVVAADEAQALALTSRIRGVETLAALSDASLLQDGPARRTSTVISLRLLVMWSAFLQLDETGRRTLITHELTHAALAPRSSGRTPAWLTEGVAMFVSRDRRPVGTGASLSALSQPDAIGRLTGTAQGEAYYTSAAAAYAIADRFGTKRLLDLYEAFNDNALRGRPGPKLVNRALRRELGISLAELEASLG